MDTLIAQPRSRQLVLTQPAWTCILFDLDGTILDSAPVITATLAYTFQRMGLPVPTPTELLRYVGPPRLDSFRDLAGFTPKQSTEALAIYRERYREQGVYEGEAYRGLPELLRDIHASGMPLSIATSKPETAARTMLEHFGLDHYFDAITGASEDETRRGKADVIAEALERLRRRGADVSRPVLVGDREHDVHGAAEHRIPTIFARWGYGSVAEERGTIAAADSPEELRDLLLP